MWTISPDTQHIHYLKLVTMTITLVWIIQVGICAIYSLCVCDGHIHVAYSAESFPYPTVLCVSNRVGTIPF